MAKDVNQQFTKEDIYMVQGGYTVNNCPTYLVIRDTKTVTKYYFILICMVKIKRLVILLSMIWSNWNSSHIFKTQSEMVENSVVILSNKRERW